MRALIAAMGSKNAYPVDFALVPVAIVLIEISVFFTQLSSEVENNLTNLILLRVLHTLAMLFISYLVSQGYKRFNLHQTNFTTLAITGVVVIALGDLTHAYLASVFDVELVSISLTLALPDAAICNIPATAARLQVKLTPGVVVVAV